MNIPIGAIIALILLAGGIALFGNRLWLLLVRGMVLDRSHPVPTPISKTAQPKQYWTKASVLTLMIFGLVYCFIRILVAVVSQ
ncbi:hypothetical protein SAMN05444159_4976 [Bradyrhizobium lablabi]|uniref:Uncharacterized protein n=1 Tax=Bradyrhizobium lablabi TaxID=722472 RepID=A0A1M6XUB9_9BRAD|nr:hypothetical protein [Bradyrhizobium lablabi]SHL09415.1 hypothetical protein SAMN05444159_4976 [Bradyrhizobium lablabi]